MNLKKYFLYLENFNPKIIYLIESDSIVWYLQKGESPRWTLLSSKFKKIKKEKEIQINHETYNKILKIDALKLHYINSDLSYVQLFEKWEILNDLSELLI